MGGNPRWTRRRSFAVASFTSLGVLLVFLVVFLISPWGKPKIEMDVVSSTAGFSQMFVAGDDRAFSEERSSWALVPKGGSSIAFPLERWRGTVGTQLRWDPLDEPAEIRVQQIRLTSGLLREQVPLESLKPSLAISEIVVGPDGAQFVAQSNDSQALLELDATGFVQQAQTRGVIASLVIAVMAWIAVWAFGRRRTAGATADVTSVEAIGTQSPPPVLMPSWVAVTLAVIGGFGALLLFRGSQLVGVSWDEPIHEASFAEFLRSGWFIPRGAFVDGIPRVADASVYAPVGAQLAHVSGAVTGAHAWFESSFSADAYAARHLAVALLSAVGVIAVSLIARILTGSWRWSLLAFALVLSIPLLLGHSMFNIKDAPVAAAFSIFTLGLILLGRSGPRGRDFVLSGSVLTGAMLLAIGNRPGIWVALFASSVVVLVALLLLEMRAIGRRYAFGTLSLRFAVILISAMVAYVLLWIVYPIAFSDPLEILRDSLSASQAFPWSGVTLTAGTFMAEQPPWTYLPLWLGGQLPILIIIFAVLGAGVAVVSFARALAHSETGAPWVRGAIPLLSQALIVPLAAIVLGTTLYGGARQLLFVFPALALLALIGIYAMFSWVRKSHSTWVERALWIGVIVGLLAPLVSQVRLFPYNFAYFNAAASVGDVDQNWDIDGWWVSGRELVQDQQFPARTICVDSAERNISSCSRMEMITPFLNEPAGNEMGLGEDQYVALSRFPYPIGEDECTPFREVTRGLYFQEIQLSHADVCTVRLAEYPQEGISFAGLTKEDPVLLWGWDPYLLWGWGEPDADGVWMVEPSASAGFLVGDDAGDSVAEISITGSGSALGAASGSLRVFVNGVEAGTIPIPAEGEVLTSSVSVPAEAISDSNEGRMVIRLEAEGVDPEQLEAELSAGSSGLFRIQDLQIERR